MIKKRMHKCISIKLLFYIQNHVQRFRFILVVKVTKSRLFKSTNSCQDSIEREKREHTVAVSGA